MDNRTPYVLSTHELGRSPGAMEHVQRTVPAPTDLANAVIGVPEGSDLDLDVRLEAVRDGVLATVGATAQLVGECSRCLQEVRETTHIDFAEMFFYPGAKQAALDEGDEEAEDMHEVHEELVDLEQPLRDAMVPALPFQPLCEPDCQGLCPGCGERMADLPADHAHEQLDPRWAALAALAGPSDGGDDDVAGADAADAPGHRPR